MCTSEKFRADMHTCLQAECTPADQLVADQLDAKFCGTQCAFPILSLILMRRKTKGVLTGCFQCSLSELNMFARSASSARSGLSRAANVSARDRERC